MVVASNLVFEVNGLLTPFYGAIAMVLFIACALFVWTFRDVANRHAPKAEAWAKAHPEHATPLNEIGEPRQH